MIDIAQEEIMQNWGVDNSENPLVSVRCTTYNQELFIAQALEGFLIQKTNFPFEIVVHDDASIDKTSEVIKKYELKYPKIIKPIYEVENQWSKHDGSITKIVNKACKGKYISYCEGDDYWIDSNKLQMQINFLEQNNNYGMCYSCAKVYNQKKEKYNFHTFGNFVSDFEDLLVNGNRIPTMSVCARASLINEYYNEIKPEEKGWKMGDYPLWLYICSKTKIKFFSKITSVYRLLQESACHSSNIEKVFQFRKSYYDIRKFYSEKYEIQIPEWNETEELYKINANFMKSEKRNNEYNKKVIELYPIIENHGLRNKIDFYLAKFGILLTIYRVLKGY